MYLIIITFLLSSFGWSLQSIKQNFSNNQEWQESYQWFLSRSNPTDKAFALKFDSMFIDKIDECFLGPENWETFRRGLGALKEANPNLFQLYRAKVRDAVRSIVYGNEDEKNIENFLSGLNVSSWLRDKISYHIKNLPGKPNYALKESAKFTGFHRLTPYFDGDLLKSYSQKIIEKYNDYYNPHFEEKPIETESDLKNLSKKRKLESDENPSEIKKRKVNNDEPILIQDEDVPKELILSDLQKTNPEINLSGTKEPKVDILKPFIEYPTTNVKLPKIHIANKYFDENQRRVPPLFFVGTKNEKKVMPHKIDFELYEKSHHNVFIKSHEINTDNLRGSYYFADEKSALEKDEPLVFIMAGRDIPSIPKNLKNQKIILVKTEIELKDLSINELVSANVDVLVVNKLDLGQVIKDKDLSRVTARRWAALLLASYYNKELVLIDDNVNHVQTSDPNILLFEKLIETLQDIAQKQTLALISLPSFKNYKTNKKLNDNQTEIEFNELGSKFFYVNLPLIVKKDPKLLFQLLPKDLEIWGEDIFLQYALHLSNFDIGRTNYDRVNLVRQKYQKTMFKSTCIGMKATKWLDVVINDNFSELEKMLCRL